MSKFRIGLALGGGGARGLTHLHVIAAMEELGLKAHVISGTSIGAIMGACIAAGMDAKTLTDHLLETFSSSGEVASKLWNLRPGSLREFFGRSFRLVQFNLEAILPEFLPDILPKNLEDLSIPFSAVAADLNKGKMQILSEGDLVSALAASASIPGLFSPVKREKKLLIDGGVCNPVPFDCLSKKVDFTIAVDVLGVEEKTFKNDKPTLRQSLLASFLISQREIIATKLALYGPDVMLRPPVKEIYVLDFLKIKDILKASKPYKEKAKVLIEKNLEKKIKGKNT